MTVLLVADRVRTLDPERPFARAVVVEGDAIRWVGDDPARAPEVDTRIDLDGAVLMPAFVDAHVHLTATGLSLAGLDLSECGSVDDCLAAVSAIAGVTPGRVIWGAGWDDSRFSDERPPSADELAAAAEGRPVLLTRTDGHSAVIDRVSLDSAPFARADGVERDAEGRPTGLLRREANHLARRWFLGGLPEDQLADARRIAAEHAVSLGIASVHEMGGPDLMGPGDFDAWRTGDWPIEVVPYWGDLDLDFVGERGLRRVGGDLFLDGSLGSRTAALADEYADGSGCGYLYEDGEALEAFLVEATTRRVQVGFHCIGDRAVHQAVDVLERVARATSVAAVRACRHRLEHCEMVPDGLIPRLAALGVVASVQPAFDAAWGGPGGMYERRLGAERALALNPLRQLHEAGVPLALGSDANVTPLDPWGGVRAALELSNPEHRLDLDTALAAAVLGGRYAARQDDVGRIVPGDRADLAAFELVRESTPAVGSCVLTMVRGRVVHQR